METALDWCGLGFGFRKNGRFAGPSLGCYVRGLGLLLALCPACSSSTSPMESTLPAQGSGDYLLRGESINDALQRLTDSCMEPFGFRYTITYPVGDDGPFPFRVYDVDPVVQARHRDCLALAAQGAGIRKLSPEELKGNWTFQTAVWACLAGRGYEVGTLVSLEEFVAAGGGVLLMRHRRRAISVGSISRMPMPTCRPVSLRWDEHLWRRCRLEAARGGRSWRMMWA